MSGRLSCAISAFKRFLWFGFFIPMAVKSSGVILPIVGRSYPADMNSGKYSSNWRSTNQEWIMSWSCRRNTRIIYWYLEYEKTDTISDSDTLQWYKLVLFNDGVVVTEYNRCSLYMVHSLIYGGYRRKHILWLKNANRFWPKIVVALFDTQLRIKFHPKFEQFWTYRASKCPPFHTLRSLIWQF